MPHFGIHWILLSGRVGLCSVQNSPLFEKFEQLCLAVIIAAFHAVQIGVFIVSCFLFIIIIIMFSAAELRNEWIK